ncbi:MAG TPA: LamG domain-containing protein [Prolixibacteraceae bacterium]|nr:LamG domain-containing protein [Prolixibacteraceae bacterium]
MKYFLLIVFALGLWGCQQDEPGIVDVGKKPLAYFPFDSSFADASGNGHLLQLHGNPEFVEGYTNEPSTAVLLDGNDDYFVSAIGKLDTFSISLWLQSYRYYVGEWPQWRSTFFDYSGKQAYGSIDGISGATQIKCGTGSEEIAATNVDNCYEWFHLYMAVKKDVKIYLNGSLQETVPLPGNLTFFGDTLYLGRSSSDDAIKLTYFYGKMDEIRIFNRILTQEEINELSFR